MKIITPEVIERARKLGACHEAITWISSCTHTTTELAQLKPNWAEWVIQNMATAPAREAYDKATAPAWEAYGDKAMAPAWEAYEAYDKATATAWEAYGTRRWHRHGKQYWTGFFSPPRTAKSNAVTDNSI